MQYGTMVLMAMLTGIGWLAIRFGLDKIKSQRIRDTLLRLGAEMRAVVAETNTVLVDELRKDNEDGKLTAEEKKRAKHMAMEMLKSNLGVKGIKRVTKVLGIESINSWLGAHISDTVDSVKAAATVPKK